MAPEKIEQYQAMHFTPCGKNVRDNPYLSRFLHFAIEKGIQGMPCARASPSFTYSQRTLFPKEAFLSPILSAVICFRTKNSNFEDEAILKKHP